MGNDLKISVHTQDLVIAFKSENNLGEAISLHSVPSRSFLEKNQRDNKSDVVRGSSGPHILVPSYMRV